MEKDEKIIAFTAAMPDGTGICTALEKFPERSFDVGIAEQHCVTFAAGMSCEGSKAGLRDLFHLPAARLRSTGARRLHSESECEVLLWIVAAWPAAMVQRIMACLDIAYLRGVPNMVLMAPERRGRDARHVAHHD